VAFVVAVLSVGVLCLRLMVVDTAGEEVMQLAQWQTLCCYGALSLLMLSVAMMLCRDVIVSALTWGVLGVVVIEAIHGFMQLYGNTLSGHSLFSLTGSFYNPGPYGGFMSLGIPLALDRYFAERNRYVRVLSVLYGLVVLSVLPATMSRTAWVAAVVAAVVVAVVHGRLRLSWRVVLSFVLGVVAVSVVLFVAFDFKVASALGRFHLWYMSLLAIAEEPLFGHGTFASAYAEAQERYFSTFDLSTLTMHGAACPDYAFCEYLHYAVVGGVPLVMVVVAMLVAVMVVGYRRGVAGLSGVMTAMGVFALASYPLHIPMFVAVLLLAVVGVLVIVIERVSPLMFLFVGLALAGMMLASRMEPVVLANREWDRVRHLYHSKRYALVRQEYEKILPQMNKNGVFLFEYGHILHNLAVPNLSNNILMRCCRHTGDPMVLNIIGKNYRKLGSNDSAMYYYRKSACRLPSRMYPYYLMFDLQQAVGDTAGMRRSATIIESPFRVESSATREMRSEVQKRIDLIGKTSVIYE
jgi:hypothetical protein